MIRHQYKSDCCGCEACAQVCPKDCISLMKDVPEGFVYPKVDYSLCIDCHLCERVCPVLDESCDNSPIMTFSAQNPSENVRLSSSSGGIFSALADKILNIGGVVFGVAFENDFRSASHICVRQSEDLYQLRGSKYFQASVNNAYIEVKELLKNNTPVLFSGTPCQVHALRLVLGDKLSLSDKLVLVEVACHGVPSQSVWERYLDDITKNNKILNVSFRDKKPSGWTQFCLTIDMVDSSGEKIRYVRYHREDVFMKSFLSNMNLRPSCYECPSKNGRSGADITIADFWGIPQELNDNKGISTVIVRTEKGRTYLDSMHFDVVQSFKHEEISRYNPAIVESVSRPEKRDVFWRYYPNINKAYSMATKQPIKYRVKVALWNLLQKVKRNKTL